jgi:hypothetical protein
MVLTFKVENNNGNRCILFATDYMMICDKAAMFNAKDFRLGIEA